MVVNKRKHAIRQGTDIASDFVSHLQILGLARRADPAERTKAESEHIAHNVLHSSEGTITVATTPT